MSEQEQTIEWYLAREGKQVGPVSDLELRKIVELGHLRPTDLVWRQGLPEWTPAAKVFPQLAAPPPAPPPPPKPPVQQQTQPGQPKETVTPRADESLAPRQGVQRAPNPEMSGPERPSAPTRPDGERFDRPTPQGPDRPAGSEAAGPGPNAPRNFGPAPGQGTPGRAPAGPGPMAGPHQRHPSGQQPLQRPREGRPGPGAALGPAAPHAGPAGPTPRPVQQGHGPAPSRDDEPDLPDMPRRRFPVKAAVAIVLLCVVGAAGILIVRSGRLEPLTKMIGIAKSESNGVPVVKAPTQETKTAPPKQTAIAPAPAQEPPATNGTTPAHVDAALQRTQLWQIIKREFPDWYNDRVADTAKLRADAKSEKEIAEGLTKALVELRRKNASAALSASPARLKFVAAKFVENLASLSKHSVDACYGFISQGETNPTIVELLRTSPQTASLQAQMAAIFEAVAEGRKAPQNHDTPKQGDYDVLAQQLAAKGWSTADLQTFIDARALARAKPERVCQMVQDWFSAQLAVKDEAIQIRLLVETLKPVVAG